MSKKDSNSSEKKKAENSVAKGSDKKFDSSKTKYIMLAVVAVIVVLVVLGIGYSLLNTRGTETEEAVTTDTIYQGTELTYRQSAQQLALSDDYEGAQQLLQDGANLTQGNTEAEAEFYVRKAELAINNGRSEEALAYAIKADEANPTVSSAALAALSAEDLNDNETAIKYYQLAADRMPESQRVVGPDIDEYGLFLEKIKQLGGSSEN